MRRKTLPCAWQELRALLRLVLLHQELVGTSLGHHDCVEPHTTNKVATWTSNNTTKLWLHRLETNWSSNLKCGNNNKCCQKTNQWCAWHEEASNQAHSWHWAFWRQRRRSPKKLVSPFTKNGFRMASSESGSEPTTNDKTNKSMVGTSFQQACQLACRSGLFCCHAQGRE